MDSILKAVANQLKREVPDLKNRVAAFTVMPSPDKVRAKFPIKPYVAVFNTGLKATLRDPEQEWVPARRRLIQYAFDVALVLDPGQELQDKDGVQAETLPQDIINALQNFSHSCWLYSFVDCQPVGNTTSEAIYALSFTATSWVEFNLSHPEPNEEEGSSIVHIKVKGSLA